MVKTGTTSIQSTLFSLQPGGRHRLLTLDPFFGNWLMGSAFAPDYGIGERFISDGVTAHMAATAPRRSRVYLDRCLAAAARRGCTPILSAEIISGLPRRGLEELRDFLHERSWRPALILYVRAPLDLLASMFQQRLRAGRIASRIPVLLMPYLLHSSKLGYAKQLLLLEEVFGRRQMTMSWFDPLSFDAGCVVRHFCSLLGLPLRADAVVRVNEGLSLDATRFLYALAVSGYGTMPMPLYRLQRAVLLRRLATLPGPPLRFHPHLTAPYIDAIQADLAWLEQRFQRTLPLTLHAAELGSGVRCEADLLDFSAHSLEWLGQASGQRPVKPRQGADTVAGVVAQLMAISGINAVRHSWPILVGEGRQRLRRHLLSILNRC